VDKILSYKDAIAQEMIKLSSHPRTLFIGQAIKYPGSILSDTLAGVPNSKKIEMPVAEDMQMGVSIGLALEGYIPITIYSRIDFLLLALNQLSNHLDVLEELSNGEFSAKVIIRTVIGPKEPLNAGIQHTRDHTEAFRKLLKNVVIYSVNSMSSIPLAYGNLDSKYSRLVIERGDLY